MAPPSPQTFEVGTGKDCFERLTAGQAITVTQGPQGGFHLWTAVGCADCPPTVIVEYGVKDPTTKAYLQGTVPQKQVIAPTGSWPQYSGLTAFLPGIAWDPKSVLPKGTHVLLSASVLDVATMAPLHDAEVEVVLGDTVTQCSSDSYCGQPGAPPCCPG